MPDTTSVEPELDREAVSQVLDDVRHFGAAFRETLAAWQALLADGDDTALWGAGAKGVTFLNAVAGGGGIDLVVDLNPRKQGRFLPGTGQKVVSPEQLRDRAPARVIVMNPMYRDEVAAALGQMDVAAEVLVA